MSAPEPEAEAAAVPSADPNDQAAMLTVARAALESWQQARDRSAAERRAARLLAWSFGRLDQLGAFAQIDRGAYK